MVLAEADFNPACCVYLVFCGVLAAVCGAIANAKGRNVAGWATGGFFSGLFFPIGIVLIIIVSVLPNLREEDARNRHVDEENRRLREQLRQERIKLDALRSHTAARLDAHDQHLGLDTRQIGMSLPDGTAPAGQLPAGDPLAALQSMGDQQAIWYYGHLGVTNGPITADQLRSLFRNNNLTGATLVWAEHLGTWRPAREVPEFANDAIT